MRLESTSAEGLVQCGNVHTQEDSDRMILKATTDRVQEQTLRVRLPVPNLRSSLFEKGCLTLLNCGLLQSSRAGHG